jgi:hypothetical protein
MGNDDDDDDWGCNDDDDEAIGGGGAGDDVEILLEDNATGRVKEDAGTGGNVCADRGGILVAAPCKSRARTTEKSGVGLSVNTWTFPPRAS